MGSADPATIDKKACYIYRYFLIGQGAKLKLGLTAILCDRGPYINEWVAFHYLVGFRKFYLYTHRCKDNTIEAINELKKHFDIKSFNVSESAKFPQFESYRHSYLQHNHEVDWMAFIDGDEFLFSPNSIDLQTQLEKFSYERLSALGVYWACYGSSNHIKEPAGLIIENFTHRAELEFPKNKHIKSLVIGHQGATVKINNAHYFETQYGTFDELMRPISWGLSEHAPNHEFFRINHYVTQSYNYYLEKKSQYDRPDWGTKRETNYWEEHNKNDVNDSSMEKFLPPLRQIMSSL